MFESQFKKVQQNFDFLITKWKIDQFKAKI